jgi:hypothetical protein
MRKLSNITRGMYSTLLTLAVLGLGSVLTSCGGASNNDQGVSFTAYGFFSVLPDGSVGGPVSASFAPQSVAGPESELSPLQGIVAVAIGLQNNLDGQTIRVQRAVISYIIPGASAQPPDTTSPLNNVLAPSINTGSSLPPQGGIPTQVTSAFVIVPEAILTWINLNRQSLPEPPFTLEAVVSARGITSAGDVIDSNALTFPITILPDLFIDPANGTTGGQNGAVGGLGNTSAASAAGNQEAAAESESEVATDEQPAVEP